MVLYALKDIISGNWVNKIKYGAMIICWLNHHWSEYEQQGHTGAIQGLKTIHIKQSDQQCHFRVKLNPCLKFVLFFSKCSCEHAHWYLHIDLEFPIMFLPEAHLVYPMCCWEYLWSWWAVIFWSTSLSKITDSSTMVFELHLQQYLDVGRVHWGSKIIIFLPC